VRPFSLGLRPFVAMFAGHILLEVFGNFVVQGLNAGIDGSPMGWVIAVLCFVFVIFVNALELLVGAIQAFVFALLTALYVKDAVHLH
jgi:F-type H+-transporting ATPase subunit a